MELVVFVLNESESLEEIMERFLQIGVRGATVIDTTGMGRTMCDNVPFFGGIRSMLQGCRPNNKTIFTVVRSEEMRNKVIREIKSVLGDMSKPNSGFLFCVPVTCAEGFAELLEENN